MAVGVKVINRQARSVIAVASGVPAHSITLWPSSGSPIAPALMEGNLAGSHSSHYNLSLSLGSLLSLPSKLISRIRKIDDMLNQDLEGHTLATTAAMRRTRGGQRPSADSGGIPYELIAMPGPLAFMTSGYAVGLVGMVRGIRSLCPAHSR